MEAEGLPFEEIVAGIRDSIREERGPREARHYMKWANGILVFFPKGLRTTVVRGYGHVIAARGTGLADLYLDHLKELYRLEKEAKKDTGFPLTSKAAERAATILSGAAQKPGLFAPLIAPLKKLFSGRTAEKHKQEAEQAFAPYKEKANT